MVDDFRTSMKLWRIWFFLSYEDIRTGYRHTLLGPWWSIINEFVFAIPVCILYKKIFKEDGNYYLYVLTGLVIWNFVSSSILKGMSSLAASGGYLKEIKLPFSLFLLQTLSKNCIVFVHGIALFVLYLIVSQHGVSLILLLVFPYLLLLVMALFFWCLIGSILVLYFRDLLQLLPRILNLLFLTTPIVWHRNVLGDKYQAIIQLNPMSTLVNIIRKPLLGIAPSLHELWVTLAIIVVGFLLCMVIYRLTKNKLIFLT